MSRQRRIALVTGIAGGLARLTGAELVRRGYEVVGVDYRPLARSLGYEATLYQANYNKTRIEDVFRRHEPTHVLHLGRVGNLKERMGKRFDLNVVGSRKVMDLSLKYGAQRLLVLSTFHIYGAHPHNHTPIYEDDPLRAGTEHPQLGDAIQLDNQALIWAYKTPQIPTVILRPCHMVGPHIRNTISRFLRQPTVPVMMGFDPMAQFIHERDMVSAILASMEGDAVGVFNVAGVSPLPFKEALALTRARLIPVPSSFASLYLRVAGLMTSQLPAYMVSFLKYPCVIATQKLEDTFGFRPRIGVVETIRSTVGR